MILKLVLPLLFASVIYPDYSVSEDTVVAQQAHTKENEVSNETNSDAILCNCVAYSRTHRKDIPFINASDMPVATTTPFVGAVAKMYYAHSGMWHVGIVTAVGDGWVDLDDANYVPCKRTQRRVYLPDRIVGYL